MIFALGFLTAGMLTLLFLPMFWRRAMRLSTRRLELQMPLSMTEIVAERDQLRAEFAAERRILEQKSEKLAAGLADSRVQLGVRSTRISDLEGNLARVQEDEGRARQLNANFELELSALELERVAAEKTYYDAAGILDRRTAELRQLTQKYTDLTQSSNEQRAAIASLKTQIANAEMQYEALQLKHADALKDLSEKISKAQFLERERDQFRSDAVAARSRREALQENIAAQQQLVEKLDGELRAGRRERSKLNDDLGRQREQLEAAADTEKRLKAELEARAKVLATGEGNLAELKAGHSAAQSALQGALDAARKENQALRSEITGLRRGRGVADGLVGAMRQPGAAANDGAARQSGGADVQTLRDDIAELGSNIIDVASADRAASGDKGHRQDNLGQQADQLTSRIRDLKDRLLPSAAE